MSTINTKVNRHIWEKDANGKHCIKCGSRINNTLGAIKYIEVDRWGIAEGVNWYPRCLPEARAKIENINQ